MSANGAQHAGSAHNGQATLRRSADAVSVPAEKALFRSVWWGWFCLNDGDEPVSCHYGAVSSIAGSAEARMRATRSLANSFGTGMVRLY